MDTEMMQELRDKVIERDQAIQELETVIEALQTQNGRLLMALEKIIEGTAGTWAQAKAQAQAWAAAMAQAKALARARALARALARARALAKARAKRYEEGQRNI